MKSLFIILSSILLISCSSQPNWQPIYDNYSQNLNQENIKYNGKIDEVFAKAEDELSTTNEYATKDEIEMIKIIQYHIKEAIRLAQQDILNYPLQNNFTKAYKRLELLRTKKITFSQAVQLSQYDKAETERAMNNAYQDVSRQQQAQWERQTRNIGKGLGKTEAQIQAQQDYQRRRTQTNTNCYNTGYNVICNSYSY